MKRITINISLFFLGLFLPALSCGQEIDLDLLKLDDYVKLHNLAAPNTINAYHQIEGTLYLYEEFKDGIVTTKDGSTYQGSFSYDIYADKMEFESLNFVFTLRDPWTIETVEFGSHTFVYIPPFDALEGHGQIISAYMKQNKMSVKKTDDLIELINYYNSL